jgi:hypothetical protein
MLCEYVAVTKKTKENCRKSESKSNEERKDEDTANLATASRLKDREPGVNAGQSAKILHSASSNSLAVGAEAGSP